MNVIAWEVFKGEFLDHFFPLELREAKIKEIVNLKQGGMGVREYVLKVTKSSKYAPFTVFYPRARISKFVLGILDMVSKECKRTMLNKEMNISRLMTYSKQIEDEGMSKKAIEPKKANIDGCSIPHQWSKNSGNGRFRGE